LSAFQCGSLKEFASLEFLTIDQLYLANAPELPSTLAYLAIQNCPTPIAGLLTHIGKLALTGYFPNLKTVSLRSDITCPGGMLGLPRRDATDVLFDEACQTLRDKFKGAKIKLCLESDLLGSTVREYATMFEYGQPGVYWPFIYLH
jgi:hypothetical protein